MFTASSLFNRVESIASTVWNERQATNPSSFNPFAGIHIYEDIPFSDHVRIVVVDVKQIRHRVSTTINELRDVNYCAPDRCVQHNIFWHISVPSKAASYSRLSTGTGHFRITVWDPALIVAQIASVQCLYYFTMCVWITIISYVVGTSRSLDVIFEFKVPYNV